MITIIYFPHGTTTDNEARRSSGWNDVELSAKGRQQSIDLKQKMKDKHIDAVFSSDLKRAIDSADLAFDEHIPHLIDPRLRECNYGAQNGGPSEIIEPLQEQMLTMRFPEGESYEDVKTRIASFLEDLKRDYPDKTIVMIAHKAPQLALEVLLNGKTWEQAFAEDWRKNGAWQAGWKYKLN